MSVLKNRPALSEAEVRLVIITTPVVLLKRATVARQGMAVNTLCDCWFVFTSLCAIGNFWDIFFFGRETNQTLIYKAFYGCL